MNLYYDYENSCLCSVNGVRLAKQYLVLHYKEQPTWNLFVYASGSTCSACPYNGAVSFRASIDVDLNQQTSVLCRTLNASINASQRTQGILRIPIQTNTEAFRTAVNGRESVSAFFELWGFSNSGVPVFYLRFKLTLSGVVDADGGNAPSLVPQDYYTASQTDALFQRAVTNASESVSSLVSNKIRLLHAAIPVMLKTNLGNIYPVEKGTITSDTSYWYIDPAAYLAYDGVSTFTGPWTVYFAGGLPEVQTIITVTGTSITPQEHQTFKHTLAAGETLSIVTSALTSTQCMTFELWLDMPSTVVSFTLPTMTWLEGSAPSMTAASTRYVIAIRWNGSKLLANLAYTESLA